MEKAGERYEEAYLVPTFKSRRHLLMVWEDIIFSKKIPLVFMKKDKRAAVVFVEQVYGQVLLDFYSSLPTLILIEDNAPVHAAKYARK